MTKALLEQLYANPDIYKIYVPLPNNPLGNLNCYVIKTPEKNLIIDTGFNLPESKEALLAGLAALEIDMAKTEIYATHLHADHTGLIGEIMLDDTVIYMSELDYAQTTYNISGTGWKDAESNMMREGFPEDEVIASRTTNPARNYTTGRQFVPKLVQDGDRIQVGDYTLTVVYVPGHTPGNTCLYLESAKILFTGDHILFDITPNITAWPGMGDALGSYLDSLRKTRSLDIQMALPAHRLNDMDVYERIDQLLAHHDNRLQNTIDTLKEFPGSNAYEVASHLKWSMRGKDWTEFPIHQKWFAVGETLSHLDYLLARDQIEKNLVDNVYQYYLK